MRRITMVALVAVLALVGAACGGDGDDSSADDTDTTADSTSDDGGDASDDGGADGGDLAAVIEGMGGCSSAAASVSASMIAGFNPQAAAKLEENRTFFEDFESKVPDDIKEDVDLFASYVDAYSDTISDFSAKDMTDPDKAQAISDAFGDLADEYPAEELDAASQNISDWFTEECPALAGG
ncbi:MAG: hypothetical protein ACJ739_10230 [Acidimicrobiales bacterium]